MTVWIVVLVAGAGSYLLRLSMIMAADRVRLPTRLDQVSALVAPAAFAALAATGVAEATRAAGVGLAPAPLIATAVAVLAVARTGSPRAALLAGMPTLWLMTALFSA
jgi:branched-subunit amino acid transport protein